MENTDELSGAEEHEVEEGLEEEDIAHFSKEELATLLERILEEDPFKANISRITSIKECYDDLLKFEDSVKLKTFIDEGGLIHKFTPVREEIDHRFKSLFKKEKGAGNHSRGSRRFSKKTGAASSTFPSSNESSLFF